MRILVPSTFTPVHPGSTKSMGHTGTGRVVDYVKCNCVENDCDCVRQLMVSSHGGEQQWHTIGSEFNDDRLFTGNQKIEWLEQWNTKMDALVKLHLPMDNIYLRQLRVNDSDRREIRVLAIYNMYTLQVVEMKNGDEIDAYEEDVGGDQQQSLMQEHVPGVNMAVPGIAAVDEQIAPSSQVRVHDGYHTPEKKMCLMYNVELPWHNVDEVSRIQLKVWQQPAAVTYPTALTTSVGVHACNCAVW